MSGAKLRMKTPANCKKLWAGYLVGSNSRTEAAAP